MGLIKPIPEHVVVDVSELDPLREVALAFPEDRGEPPTPHEEVADVLRSEPY